MNRKVKTVVGFEVDVWLNEGPLPEGSVFASIPTLVLVPTRTTVQHNKT